MQCWLQVDFFSEVSIMEALSPSPCATQLIDFGIDTTADAMFLVMKDYRCSLRSVAWWSSVLGCVKKGRERGRGGSSGLQPARQQG